jgi:hypothetical protein
MRHAQTGIIIALVIGLAAISGPVHADGPSLALAATRRDATGAVYSIPPVTDRKGDPQPPLLLPGEYVVVSGTGLPPNQPIEAALATQTHTFPLPYQAVNGAVQPTAQPMTDASGMFQDLTFALPPADQVTDTTGDLVILAGGTRVAAPVAIVTTAGATAGPEDKRAVAFGALYLILALIVILYLLRGLPVYPASARQAGSRRTVVNSDAK